MDIASAGSTVSNQTSLGTADGDFFLGFETDAYVNDAKNCAIYDVNTIANYDPEIIPFLDAPICSAFHRDEQTGKFREEPFTPTDDE